MFSCDQLTPGFRARQSQKPSRAAPAGFPGATMCDRKEAMEIWRRELRERVTTLAELEKELDLVPAEREWFRQRDSSPGPHLPFAVTRYYLSLMDDDPENPLRRQAVPRAGEFLLAPGESDDPLCELRHSPVPGLVHRYEDRALFMAGSSCALYCRHCFRRHFTGGEGRNGATGKSAREAAAYISGRPEIRELLVSGGDPLMLPDRALAVLLETFRAARPDIIIRVGTRVPAVLPSRITAELASLLGSFAPLYLISQFNHPLELSSAAREAAARLAGAGVVMLNQSVLLRGVNDSEQTIRELSAGLLASRIIPYYLFQGDLAEGTSHLRAPLSRGIEIMRSLRQRMSGLATPTYAVDLPGGGGKCVIPLEPPPESRDGFYRLKGPDGTLFPYPDEG